MSVLSSKPKTLGISARRNPLSKLMPSDAFSMKILKQRAKDLAVVEKDDHSLLALKTDYIKFVTGNNEYYGIPYEDIQDIKALEHITKVPMSPDFVLGISYWHGKIIPVIDLASYFGIESKEKSESRAYIATIAFEKTVIGICFDDVLGVESYLEIQLDRSITTNNKISESYVYGIHAGKITILNVKNILADISAKLMNEKGV